MRRARFHRLAGAVITTTLVLTSTLPAEALAPIDTTSTEGAHLLTIPLITGSGGGTAVDIADNGWVALSQGLWEGIGYPRRDIAPNPFGSPNPDFTVTAIGTDGTVVGNYPPDSTGRRSLFVRRPDGTIVTPAAPPGDSGALAVVPVGISDEGYIAGTYHAVGNTCGPSTSGTCSFLATPDADGNYTMQTLPPTPTGGRFFTTAIGGLATGSGIVIGGSGWTWSPADGFLALTGGVPRDVNRTGAMTGTISPQSGVSEAAYWSDPAADPILLGSIGADTQSFAWALDNSDRVVGWSGTSASPSVDRRAFVWIPGTGEISLLGTTPGGTTSEATGITDDGLVVGMAQQRPVIWDLDGDYDIDYPPEPTLIATDYVVEEGDVATAQVSITDADGDPFERHVRRVADGRGLGPRQPAPSPGRRPAATRARTRSR